MTYRILLADDHAVVRAGLVAIINAEADLEVVGEASDAAAAMTLVLEKSPDLLIMDISMPDLDGIQATHKVKQLAPDLPVLILTIHEDRQLMEEAIRAGAGGYVLKQAIKAELIHAVQTVLRGEIYLHPVMTRMLLESARVPAGPAAPGNPDPAPSQGPGDPQDLLTPRELDVLLLIAQGYTNRQAAERLELSVRTVEYHRRNLTGKLGLQGRVELMRYAEEHGLL